MIKLSTLPHTCARAQAAAKAVPFTQPRGLRQIISNEEIEHYKMRAMAGSSDRVSALDAVCYVACIYLSTHPAARTLAVHWTANARLRASLTLILV
jgi:hypothetical protein